jgi:DNA repair exonuclease SbcCD nuclease subunit
MKISLASDLHLECGYQELPGGEVLILAGDICEARKFRQHFHATKTLYPNGLPNKEYQCSEFFRVECAKYDKVFMVMGNHEHYGGYLQKTYNELLSMLPGNVTLLEDQAEEYNGVMFMGSTLWTDYNRGDPVSMMMAKQGMNDYRSIIQFNAVKSVYHKLTPDCIADVHFKTKQYFKTMLELNRDKPVVMITHMAPSFMSVNEKYKHDVHMNGCYASDLSDMILDNTNIKYWFHGHMHDRVNYTIGETRIVSNPRGYLGYEDTDQFDPNFTIEL